jgi:hypothetical protein
MYYITFVISAFPMHIDSADTVDSSLVAEQVYEGTRRSILRGEVPKGTRVIEVHIPKTLGTRAPVRDEAARAEWGWIRFHSPLS